MKNILTGLATTMLLILFCLPAAAQHTDNLNNIYILKNDSLYRLSDLKYRAVDSLYADNDRRSFKILRSYKSHDSVYLADRKKYDSVYRTFRDTVKRKPVKVYNQKARLNKGHDSLFASQKKLFIRSDSLRKLYRLDYKPDSLRPYEKYHSIKLDSLKKLIYLESLKTDSQRIKKYLYDKKMQLSKLYEDSVNVKNYIRSRKLTMEITCRPGDTVYINNNYRKVNITTIPSEKLRLSTVLNYKETVDETDKDIFQKMGIGISRERNTVTVTIDPYKQRTVKDTDPCYDMINMEVNTKRSLLVELPGNAVIILTSKYGETNIKHDVTSLDAKISNGSLKMLNAGQANITGTYSTIKANEIKKARLNLSSVNFSAGNIGTMSVVSGSSVIKLDNCNSMDMISTSDDYRIDKAGSISGSKRFGKLGIERLDDQLVLTGASADIQIDKLSYTVPFIKIDNKYADVKLPLYDIKNYAVYYEGSYKDVAKLSTATQTLNGMGSITARLTVAKDSLYSTGGAAGVNKTKFEAIGGDISGLHAKIDIICPFCNVVFN